MSWWHIGALFLVKVHVLSVMLANSHCSYVKGMHQTCGFYLYKPLGHSAWDHLFRLVITGVSTPGQPVWLNKNCKSCKKLRGTGVEFEPLYGDINQSPVGSQAADLAPCQVTQGWKSSLGLFLSSTHRPSFRAPRS